MTTALRQEDVSNNCFYMFFFYKSTASVVELFYHHILPSKVSSLKVSSEATKAPAFHLELTEDALHLVSCSPVVGHQRGGGHRRDGRGPRSDLGPAGGPGAARQHLHLLEGRQEPPQHADQPAAAAPAPRPRRHAHLLGLRGGTGEDGTTGHSQGKTLKGSWDPGNLNDDHLH